MILVSILILGMGGEGPPRKRCPKMKNFPRHDTHYIKVTNDYDQKKNEFHLVEQWK